MPIVKLPDNETLDVYLSPCVTVLMDKPDESRNYERAIHEALKKDPRYLFVTLTGGTQWTLSVQWGVGNRALKSDEVFLSASERSPAQVALAVKREVSKLTA